jgi:hypothetical protein
MLAKKIREVGIGAYGQIPMPPNPTSKISDDELKAMVEWVLTKYDNKTTTRGSGVVLERLSCGVFSTCRMAPVAFRPIGTALRVSIRARAGILSLATRCMYWKNTFPTSRLVGNCASGSIRHKLRLVLERCPVLSPKRLKPTS